MSESVKPDSQPSKPVNTKMAKVIDAAKELLMFVPSILIAFGIYYYLLEQARPFTPPEGYVFPREPVLEGVYRLEHHPGRNATLTFVGTTSASCSMPSYYRGTLAAHFASHDCGLEKELNGKFVRIERVRVPGINDEINPIVVRISHEGHDYRHVTDETIRDRWIFWTAQDAAWGAGNIWLVIVFSQLGLTYGKETLYKFFKGVKKWLAS